MFSNPAYMALADGGKGKARLGIRYQPTTAWHDMGKEVDRRLGELRHKAMGFQTLRRRVGPASEVLKGGQVLLHNVPGLRVVDLRHTAGPGPGALQASGGWTT